MKTQKQAIPKTLLLSTTNLTDSHLQAVLSENEIERSWYEDVPGYRTIDEIRADVETGKLVKVEPDNNIVPIMRLRNPELVDTYPPYLLKDAAVLLIEVGEAWRRAMDQAGLDKTIHIAVTSLIRTTDYQATLVKAGKLADPDSPHTRGAAFDLDASGYYLGETPVNPRNGLHPAFHQAFKELGAELPAPAFGDAKLYNPRVHELLKMALEAMQRAGKLHFVHEFPGTGNDVYHVCYNPEYRP
jgi:hypothetical protein